MIFTYSFQSGDDGWTADFADYPVGEESFYELEWEHTVLPAPLDQSEGALKVSGNNHSDDLFMFIKKKLTGLTPNQLYEVTIRIEFASDVPDDSFGVGGSPGEGVTIKAGATQIMPDKIIDGDNYYRMNIDKSNQAGSGKDMVAVGDFSNDTDQSVYTLKTVVNGTPHKVEADGNGELWIAVGTDSGFEATTTIYYNSIEVELD